MQGNKSQSLSVYAGYIGFILVLIPALLNLIWHVPLSVPLFGGLLAGLILVSFSFFKSGFISLRQVKYGSNSIVMVALFGCILGLANYIARRYPQQFDLTKQGIYTLSDQTIKIVQSLNQPVHAMAFLAPPRTEEEMVNNIAIKELLHSYERYSDKFKVELVDPDIDRTRALSMKVQDIGTVVFVAGDEVTENSPRYAVTRSDYVETDYSGAQMGQAPTSQFKGEQAFTSAILKVTGGEKKKVYFLTGHQELDPQGEGEESINGFKDALESEGYSTDKLLLAKDKQVPQDASLVIVAGPKLPLLPLEAQILINYVKGGGRVFLMPYIVGMPNLNEMVSAFGVNIGDDIVIDPARAYPLSAAVTLSAPPYPPHEITEKIAGYTVFPYARSVKSGMKQEPWTIAKLIETTGEAWGETNPNAKPLRKDAQDSAGPLSLMVAVEGAASDVPAEVKVEAANSMFGFGEIEMPDNPTPEPTAAAAVEAQPTQAAPAPAPETQPTQAAPAPSPAPEAQPTQAAPAPSPAPEAQPTQAAPAPAPETQPTQAAPAPSPAPETQPTQAAPAPAPAEAATPSGGGQGGGLNVPTPAPTAAEAKSAEAAKTLRWSDQGKMVVLGSAVMISNDYFLSAENRNLIMNTVGWLVDKKELISIRAKDRTQPKLTMSGSDIQSVFWLTMVFVPAGILLLGISIWYRRR